MGKILDLSDGINVNSFAPGSGCPALDGGAVSSKQHMEYDGFVLYCMFSCSFVIFTAAESCKFS